MQHLYDNGIEMVTIDRQELRETSVAAIAVGINVAPTQAEKIVDQFEYAELSNKRTHGFVRVPWLIEQRLDGHVPTEVDGNNGPIAYAHCSEAVGYLAASEITAHITERISEQPVQMIVARDIFPTNVLGYHVREIAQNEQTIGVIFGTTPKLVTGPGMNRKLLGTNPLAVGFSHEGHTVISDITTASTSLGQLLVAKYWGGFTGGGYRTAESTVPSNVAELYENTKFTGTIAQDVDNSSDRRLYALGMVLQLLTGIVSGTNDNRGNLVVVGVDKSLFTDGHMIGADSFMNDISYELMPGMRSHQRYTDAQQSPNITLPLSLVRAIQHLPS